MGLMFPIYFISLILSAGMTLLSAYQILELSDLDCDYINPQRCCANLNKLVVPEILCVGLLVAINLLTLNWIPVATTLPMLTWLIYKYRSTPQGYVSLFDSTNICDQKVLNKNNCEFCDIHHSDNGFKRSQSNQATNFFRDDPKQPLLGPAPQSHSSEPGFSCIQQANENRDSEMLTPRTQKNINSQRSEIDGFQAWLTLVCIFVINASTLGSLKIYGIIFEEIVSQGYYNREDASWPISTASTVQNVAGLLTPLLALKISWRKIEIIQTILFVSANIGAYFSRCLALDVFCLGIVQGVAFSLRYNMNVVINNEYFAKYRSTAMGVSLAGSTCGVFALKPIISHVIDISNQEFRNAYLTLGIIMSFNIILNFFIRKPKSLHHQESQNDGGAEELSNISRELNERSVMGSIKTLVKNPSIHCIWIMQTIYFYISRTYTIFIVDYGLDKGFTQDESRILLNYWVYGELGGRLLLGGVLDSRLMNLKWNIVIVNMLLAISEFALLLKPSIFGHNTITNDMKLGQDISANNYYFWFVSISIASIAALSSLVTMLIIPFGQEYLGKNNVSWAFAMGSLVTGILLLFRPNLIGLSRDYYKSYDLLIIVMSAIPCIYSILFILIEPYFRKA